MSISLETSRDRPLVIIAGGGIAALEACLAVRHFASDRDVDVELLAPGDSFAYRPLSVLAPFRSDTGWSMPLEAFAAANDVHLVRDELASVDVGGRRIHTASGATRPYDLLLVAIGARGQAVIPGALTFRGDADAPKLRELIDGLEPSARIAFAVPDRTSWPLPAYELAILSAARLAPVARGQVAVVTPEREPLELFGEKSSRAVAALLARTGVAVVLDASPQRHVGRELKLDGGRALPADAVVALARPLGPAVAGLPHDERGFVPVDVHGRVEGCERVFAAGDLTDYPIKQGGLACQQADAAAEAMLADIGLPIQPRPFSPRLQGVLLTDREPTYMQAPSGERDGGPEPRPFSLWWPPTKVAGRHLSAYLTIRAGAPRAPELRPDADARAGVVVDRLLQQP